MFLEAHFGEVELYMPEGGDEREQGEENNEPLLLVRLDEAEAHVDLVTLVSVHPQRRKRKPRSNHDYDSHRQ